MADVTVSLPDRLLRDVRHLAVDEGVSLSRFVARSLEERAMSIQVLQELFVTLTKRLLRQSRAESRVGSLSYWDAAIVAAARALGCNELLSEDMSHGRIIDGVLIRDPFR